jgi:hypothetical protein
MRITSITPMKDEAPFILEWIAYHQLIGVRGLGRLTDVRGAGTPDLQNRSTNGRFWHDPKVGCAGHCGH